ncbi:hypothetical protein PVAND_001896 [Polypedilum vanderplanki]|uniref:Protein aurora borealis n=1 Tax=Polypedilum vanderplanki TaxID=319348 RepID=A0A9J6BPD2_POLVA|nr:hypothetical protein PVAND_001896 [Polypedilum vanderplanki]
MEEKSCDKTPKRLLNSELTMKKTPISTSKSFASRFLLLSNNSSSTPTLSPSLRKHIIVRNPFENSQLHEKLHLPVISSPSLFYAPSTPKNNSAKLEVFEWTIEELSNLNPVNVIPHETQFRSEETDPDKEAQVQAAISSFFNEQKVVPSPINTSTTSCLRNKFELNRQSTPTAAITNAEKYFNFNNKRDVTTQTACSFPTNLPQEIEDLLKKYQYNDESCNTNKNADDEEHEINESSSDQSMMDISTLRRKLFINPETPERNGIQNESFAIDLTNLSPAPRTPEFSQKNIHTSVADITTKTNDIEEEQINSSLFGELSPISKFDSSSTNSSPIMSSSMQDISMASDVGVYEHTPTGSRLRCNKLKKKRLSDSFSMLHNEESLCDKENDFDFHPVISSKETIAVANKGSGGIVFQRYDSGFNDSNQMMNFSTEFMQI